MAIDIHIKSTANKGITMNSNNEPIKPKIDDLYWFNFSETLISNSQERPDKAAEKLQKLVIWLWGIYTSYAAVGFALSKKQFSILTTVLIVAASASLIVVYWCTVWVQMPLFVQFDPRSPTTIKEAYESIVKAKRYRLNVTLSISVIASIMVSIALAMSSVGQEHKQRNLEFKATINLKDNRPMLALTGTVGKTDTVTVNISPLSTKEKTVKKQKLIFMPMDDGLLQLSIPLETKAKELEVELEWKDSKGMKTRLSKRVREKEVTM